MVNVKAKSVMVETVAAQGLQDSLPPRGASLAWSQM